ncbi:hypothetical protein DICPUDRAFT_80829 [Dictyostelium purpureum]|uniref:Ribosomal protein S15 n=1 Tax=Dictyostelium purpureum TaxID=5786 RepID=F0ZRN5_DICPU|nr:uncharacterized protein DICPUDRAFT_80829 [Dictyostelium purpureum]EGC33415.1 hypothetical protein DICPUDRAFT_80829 [Dictyostelium purpureum]|eukprot:XP_003290079.1 hypothetical protein DICPUDRAFT_80829 [Dictyostelium purpureum]
MIRLFQRSLVISKDQAFKKCSGLSYNIREFCSNNNNNELNLTRKEFEEFKNKKEFIKRLEENLDENNVKKSFQVDNEKPIDYEFISNKLGIKDNDKYIKVQDLVSEKVKQEPGFENFDLSVDEAKFGLQELEKLLRAPNGEKTIGLLINELKQVFGLESDQEMDRKLKNLQESLSLKLGGVSIEEFIAQNRDNMSSISREQRAIVHEYFENHPYIKNIRQTSFVLDLINLSEQYRGSDSKNFEENIRKHFNIDQKTTGSAEEDGFKEQDLDQVDFIPPADSEFVTNANKDNNFEESVVDLIKSGTILTYMRKVFEDAKESADPVSAKLEKEAKEATIAKELESFNQIAQREIDSATIKYRENSDNPEDFYDADVTPEFDMMQPVQFQEQAKDPRDLLKYYHLYPKKIKQWINYTHTPMGIFSTFGVWYNLPTWYTKFYQPSPPETFITPESENVFQQPEIPEDLRNSYRFGVTEEEARLLHPKFKEFLTFQYATQPEVTAFRKRVCIEKYGTSLQDSGSPMVQISILTEKINVVQAHLAKNKKDYLAKKNLPMLERRRRNLIKYLKKKNIEQYFIITKDLKLKNFNY